ncbi:MAG: co-chaperone GroES family protein [Methylococcaceae bacterium]
MKNYKPINNYLLVRPHLKTDEINFNTGKLKIDTSFEKEKHAPTKGEVVSVPDSLFYRQKEKSSVGKPTPNYTMLSPDPYPHSTTFDVDMEALPGDVVYFHYLTKNTCEQQGRLLLGPDNQTYYLIPYDQCFVLKRKNNIIPINGYILAEKLAIKKEKIGLLDIPESLKITTSSKFAKIKHIGGPVRGYRGEHEICEMNINVNVGDIVIYDKNSDIPIQYEYHNDVDDKNKYVRMQRRDISAIIPEEYFNKIYFE